MTSETTTPEYQTTPAPAWPLAATHDLLTTPDFSLQIEEYRSGPGQLLLAQALVAHVDPSVLEAIRTTWAAFRSVTNAPVFTCADIGSEERDSFIASLGFRSVSEVRCADGETRRVYVSLPA